MNKRSTPQSGSVDEAQREFFEQQLLSISKKMDYPRTPDVTGFVMKRLRRRTRFLSRTLAWSLTVLLILCSSLMLIPSARAAILEFIQIGAVRIFRVEPTPMLPPNEELPVPATPYATAQPLIPMLENLAGETTLAEAQQTVDYSLLLPSYPSDLGPPDRVFVQDADGDITILVWIDPQRPAEVLMSLHFIPPGSWAVKKVNPTLIEETTVNGQRAIWAIGPYPLRFSNGDLDFTRLVDGHVLIWAQGEMTYRLETDLGLEEALKVAESLKAIP